MGNTGNPKVRAFLDDGSRSGEILILDAAPDGGPPRQVVVSYPPGMDGRQEESFDVGTAIPAATTYYLHGPHTPQHSYLYRTSAPV
jgi:hypothetical protein